MDDHLTLAERLRLMRWSDRVRLVGTDRIDPNAWRKFTGPEPQRDLLTETIRQLLGKVQRMGGDLTDLVITVSPDRLPPGAIRVELRGVKR